ncbi:dTDP-4-dehydrorhamnose reductase [Novosphingobium sp. UBA1939]|uniref:dTDP-4-dehydrorhamnose reductase n=1 Tax=Novosphingobium sp. UBA1939 TaxID=1946982 RepID=UPI0025EDF30D|nr:dTDP-4-dehydrorhamnose reductase [Novosphingobium sp. UBA1939]
MRLAVTGLHGQVVRAMLERAHDLKVDVIPIGRPQIDLADAATITGAFDALRPDAIVSAAAYTAVNQAEAEPELAQAVNCIGAAAVAAEAARLNVPVIHLSTDYVFNGRSDRPWREDDMADPLGVYGRTKLAGERAVAAATANHAILRTAWIYSPFGSNFAKTMLRLAREMEEIKVVEDQIGNPTSAGDIADGIAAVARNLVGKADPALRGTFHLSSQGEASWADFAEAIFALSAEAGGPSARVRRISTAEFPTPTERPANSRLDCGKLARVHGVALPFWRDSARTVIARLVSESATA